MKLTELISHLQVVLDEEGDINTFVEYEEVYYSFADPVTELKRYPIEVLSLGIGEEAGHKILVID